MSITRLNPIYAATNHTHSNYAAKDQAVKSITRSGTTFTATRCDGTTFTFTQQDNNSLPGVTHGVVTKSVNFSNSWHGHYYGEATITFANQNTTSYTLVVTVGSGSTIIYPTVKSKATTSATLFLLQPHSGTYNITLNYIIIK